MALVATPPFSAIPTKLEDFDESEINVFLKMWDGKMMCCRIHPKHAAITKLDYLTERVLEEYSNDDSNFYFEMQGKPLNEITCNSLIWMDGSTVFVQYRNRGGCFMVSLTVLTMIMIAIVGSTCTCGLSLFVVPLLLPLLFILPLFCL